MKIPDAVFSLPATPGCYIFRDKAGGCLYVGKSKNVRARVRSYFNAGNPPKVLKLAASVTQVEYRPANNEINALFIEYNLIKHFKPVFNRQFNRDIHPYFICVNRTKRIPGIYISDNDVHAEKYGSFTSVYDATEALMLVSHVWKIPICMQKSFDSPASQDKACLRLHIGKCFAPCEGVPRQEYMNELDGLADFLRGGGSETLKRVALEMNQAADAMEYEKAAELRNLHNKLIILGRRVKGKISFDNRRICVFIRCPSDADFMFMYFVDGCVLEAYSVADINAWEGYLLGFLARQVKMDAKRNNLKHEQCEIYTPVALMEIRARKCIVDITRTRPENIADKLNKACRKLMR